MDLSQLLSSADNIIGIKKTKKWSCKRRPTIALDANDINGMQKARKALLQLSDDNVVLFAPLLFVYNLSLAPKRRYFSSLHFYLLYLFSYFT